MSTTIHRCITRAGVASLLAAFTAPAAAGSPDWTQINGLFAGNLTGGTDTQGSILVGGNFALNGGTVGAFINDNTQLGLGVVGNLTGGGNLNGGFAVVGGGIFGGLNPNSGASITQNNPVVVDLFNDAWSSASDASIGFGNLSINSSTNIAAGNKLIFDARGATDFAVFGINASDLSNFQAFQLLSDTEATIVINVTGANASTVNINATMNENGQGVGGTSFRAESERVIWNFLDATGTVNVNRQVQGSVLALDAALNASAVIEGNAVFASGALNGQELHLPTFDGSIPPIPAPGVLALLGANMLVCVRRRR